MEYFSRRGGGHGRRHGSGGHHGGHHGSHNLIRKYYDLDYGPYGNRGYDYSYPIYSYPVNRPATCGGENCNIYQDTNDKNKYASLPGTQCKCCSLNKTCRLNKDDSSTVKYNDCCSGYDCIPSNKYDKYGFCTKF